MTRKPTLQRWASTLGAEVPASATVQELEAAIENAIATPSTPPDPEPQYTLREGLRNNWAVIRAELPGTVKAIAANLRS